MGFMNRLSALLQADAHGAIDALEDRALMLRQHVREASAALDAKRAQVAASDAELKALKSQSETLDERLAQLEADAALAVEQEEEDLARFALGKLLPAQRQAAALQRRREELHRRQAERREELARQEDEFADLDARARAFLARIEHGEEEDPLNYDPIVAPEEIEIELMRRRRAATGGA